MTRDDIIEMAREAGFVINEKARKHQPNCIFHTHYMVDEMLERFAHLVAAHEREECAKIADAIAQQIEGSTGYVSWVTDCADAIRARTKK